MSNRLRHTNDQVRPRAWIVIALGDGSSPYDDHSGVSYQYDSKVQNHKQVQEGDLFFIRSRTGLQGAGQIRRIEIGSAQKDIPRCPQCSKSLPAKSLRSDGRPMRCSAGHTFAVPQIDKIDVKTFRAHFDGEWMTADKAISAIELRRFSLSKSPQLSIMPADCDGLVDFVASWSSTAFRNRLRAWSGRSEPLADDEATEGPDLTPEGEDRRPAALRSIRLRRGQRDFRDALISRYNGRCAISGCSILGVLEAAHLRPYRGLGDHHPSNGLLLRSDLHTLFDLDLLGIDPNTCRVVLGEILKGSEYEQFRNVSLANAEVQPPDKEGLQQRWKVFCSVNLLIID